MILDQTLLAAQDAYVIYPARALGEGISFGESEVLGTAGTNNTHLRLKQRRAITLRCQHIITQPEDVGGFCLACLAEASGEEQALNPWEFAICVRCRLRCSVPFCPIGNVLCPNHAAEHPSDKKTYCPIHFACLDEDLRLGKGVAGAKRWLQSIVSTDKKKLP